MLITVNSTGVGDNLARELRGFIIAVQRTKSIGKIFTYKFYFGKDHFKTKRIRKDNKVFGLYRSMIEKEAEKINSAVLKYIIMFVVIISLAGVMFKFVFLNIILGMGKSPSQDPQQEIVQSILEDPIKTSEDLNNDGMYRIIGIVDDHYIVNIALGSPLCIGLLYQKSYLITEHIHLSLILFFSRQ